MIDAKSEKEVEGTDWEGVYKQDDQQNRIIGVQQYNMYESSDWQDSAIIQEILWMKQILLFIISLVGT
jgi:hypothetical protein